MFGLFKAVGKSLGIPTSKAEFIISSVDIAHMGKGTITVIYKALCGNEALYREVDGTLRSTAEINSYTIDNKSGSVTINYDHQKIRPGTFLGELLVLAQQKYDRNRKS